MFQVKIDKEKNRLYLFLGKITGKNDFSGIVCETERVVRYLKQGFSCVSDLRGFKVKGSDHNFMQSIQETLWDSGVKLVIRVVDKDSITEFSHEEKSVTWPAYNLQTVSTLEEAEKILEENNL